VRKLFFILPIFIFSLMLSSNLFASTQISTMYNMVGSVDNINTDIIDSNKMNDETIQLIKNVTLNKKYILVYNKANSLGFMMVYTDIDAKVILKEPYNIGFNVNHYVDYYCIAPTNISLVGNYNVDYLNNSVNEQNALYNVCGNVNIYNSTADTVIAESNPLELNFSTVQGNDIVTVTLALNRDNDLYDISYVFNGELPNSWLTNGKYYIDPFVVTKNCDIKVFVINKETGAIPFTRIFNIIINPTIKITYEINTSVDILNNGALANVNYNISPMPNSSYNLKVDFGSAIITNLGTSFTGVVSTKKNTTINLILYNSIGEIVASKKLFVSDVVQPSSIDDFDTSDMPILPQDASVLDYITYAFKMILWLINTLFSFLGTVLSTVAKITGLLGQAFSFFPPPIPQLFVIGIIITIIVSIIKR